MHQICKLGLLKHKWLICQAGAFWSYKQNRAHIIILFMSTWSHVLRVLKRKGKGSEKRNNWVCRQCDGQMCGCMKQGAPGGATFLHTGGGAPHHLFGLQFFSRVIHLILPSGCTDSFKLPIVFQFHTCCLVLMHQEFYNIDDSTLTYIIFFKGRFFRVKRKEIKVK